MSESPQRERSGVPVGSGALLRRGVPVRSSVVVRPGRRRPRAAALLITSAALAAQVALAGCSHPAGTAPASPSASASVSPAPGDSTSVPLTVYGITDGPADFRLPAGLVVLDTMDQPNVVTLVLGPDSGASLAEWLRQHLPDAGYHVDAAGHGSVVFHGSAWSGAFTSDSRLAGLTIRRNR